LVHTNVCVPAQCRTDADCGPNGACSPSFDGFCAALSGYHCHSAADSCNSNSDCCSDTPECTYQPALGHFACAAFVVCMG
jgi:hypothetical protein